MNEAGLRQWVRDLRQEPPRSPRDLVGGFVILGRCVDKCRASLLEVNGEYNYWPCALCEELEAFTGVGHEALRDFVATGADDDTVGRWLREQAGRDDSDLACWNWRMRDKRLSDLRPETQLHLEEYVAQHLPKGRPIYTWFDLYDIEEGRL